MYLFSLNFLIQFQVLLIDVLIFHVVSTGTKNDITFLVSLCSVVYSSDHSAQYFSQSSQVEMINVSKSKFYYLIFL